MILSDVSVRRPVFATVISLLLLITGLMAAQRLAIREYPDISRPVVNVQVTYRGASAAVVESKVTQVLENQLAGIEGLSKLTSSSQDERSQINIEFSQDRDIESAANDVRDRVSRVQGNLPEEADTPRIAKADANFGIVMFVNVLGNDMTELELSDYADRNIVDRFAIVPGVANANLIGERRYAMRVWLDRAALAARGLTVQDVENALRAENVELPAGRLESSEREFILNTDAGMSTAQAFRELVIGRGADYLVRLGEVAEVNIDAEDFRSIYRTNGVTNVGIGIQPTSTANVVEVAQGVRAEIERIKRTLPQNMDLLVSIDNTQFVEQSLNEVVHTIAITLGLVLVVIYGFLGSARATIIPAVTIPVSIVSACLVMAWLGYSINTLTLLGAVLAVAIVVDDAIVVLENIVRRIEAGEPALLAAVDGTREIGFAVIATTLVLCAVFLPISFMEGNIGRLFSEFGVTIAAGIAFSSIIALSLVPMMSSKLFANGIQHGRISHAVDRGYRWLSDRYERSLRAATTAPWMIVAIAVATLPLSYALFESLPSEYAPLEDRGMLQIRVQAPEGASLGYMDRYLVQVEDIVRSELESGNAEMMIARTGGPGARGPSDVTSGMVFLRLADFDARDEPAQQIAQRLRQALNDVPGVRVNVITPASLGVGGGSGRPVQLVLGGGTYEEIVRWRDVVIARAQENPGLQNIESDYYERSPQIKISIDRDRAGDLGVSLTTVGRTLETMMGSRRVTTFLMNGEEYNVVLQAREADRATPTDLDNIYVRSSTGSRLIPLSNLVRVEEIAGPLELKRFDRLRAITISAGLAPGYSLGEALDYLEGVVREELPPDAQINYDGESREFRLSGGALYTTFVLALLVVFLVLAAQFESFRHPTIIITTVPLAVTGALLGLWFQGSSINVFSQIGAIMLIGLAAKNGILIVEFANQLRDRGVEFADSIVQAAVIRLRPVLMTSLCMVFGAMPLLLATGAGAEARKSLGAVVIFGVLFSMVMTLYVVPSVYLLLARKTRSPQYVARMIDRLRGTKSLETGGEGVPSPATH